MSAVLEAWEPSARYLDAAQPTLVRQFDLLAMAPAGVRKLRALIQTLAVQGKLVAQYPGDEPASALLNRVRTQKARMVSAGDIRAAKPFAEVAEDEQPFSLPATWTWARFGDVTINRDGERIPVSSDDREQRAKVYDYYGASGVIDKIDGYLFDKTLLLIGEDGANLLNRSTPIAFLAHGKYWVNNHAHVIDTIEPGLMRYLELFINAISLERYVTGTAQPKMNQAKLNDIVVALPPLAEQARIVTRVDELMRLCDALEANGRLEAEQHARLLSTLLSALTESSTPQELAANWQRVADHFDLLLDRPEAVGVLEQVILQLGLRGVLLPSPSLDESPTAHGQQRSLQDDPFAWPTVKFGDVLTDLRYGTSAKCSYAKSGTPVLRIPNLRDGAIDISDLKLGELEPKEVDNLRLEVGDLLIIRSNGSAGLVGTAALVSSALPGFAFAGYLVRARLDRAKVVPHFMALVLRSPEVRRQIEGPIRTTSGVKNINSTEIQRISFTLPPLELQDLIVRTVTELRRLCAELHERLDRCDAVQAALADAMIDHAGTT